jgi:ketosteroid isomerase-like protein
MESGQPDPGEADIRARIDLLVSAIRAHDLEAAMSLYAVDVVSFDFEPPLQHVGADAKRRNWVAVFEAYERPLGYEVHDLNISVAGDIAFTHSLNRVSGTLKNGAQTDMWLRATMGLRQIDGVWLIGHDQVSVPVDFATGMALRDLSP